MLNVRAGQKSVYLTPALLFQIVRTYSLDAAFAGIELIADLAELNTTSMRKVRLCAEIKRQLFCEVA